ncbi:MAG: M3 family metallopeptidase [Bacteroidales bacterium]|jgi:peptidyl-dipeptidase Dcp|nr:M3 family metallopeptidase [Bacteroidales bacterium]
MTACTSTRTNPFLTEWNTPLGIPPFEQIQEADYLPALEEGIKQHDAEIAAIIANPDAPTFDNVIAAYDQSGLLLAKVVGVLFNLAETDNTPTLEKIVEDATNLMSKHENDITFNKALFDKVKAVNDQKASLGLTREQEMVLDKVYRSFADNGIALDEAGQARMKEINTELSALSNRFGNFLLKENNAFKAKFGISVSEYTDAMTTEEDRAKREAMFRAYANRGNNGNENDTKEIILNILKLKEEKAKLLGYENPAAHILSDKMAKTPQAVDAFLANIFKYAVSRAKEEVKDMQKVMDQDIKAGKVEKGARIQPWDWFYYAEKVRKAKYALDEEITKPYFQMENVREGVFNTASKLYGLKFEKIENAPKYHPDVEAFKVTDADGSLIGVLTTDYFPRESKRGGAWMNNIRDEYVTLDGQMVRPIIVNVGNFNKPTADTPSLLSLDNVETMFHEFGHALHGLLTQCHYRTVSGTAVARDFVELPSQINENWAFQKEVLAGYAKHYQTGEVIPDELVDKIIAAGNFNQGFMTTELCAASILDMKWHELSSVEGIDIEAFEKQACKEMGLIDEIIPRYRTTYFNHIFNSGYSAGYYSYLWAEVLDKDAFELFLQKGIFDPATAKSFRQNVLEKGGSDDPMTLYKNFRGAEPDPDALLRARGLK